MGTNLASPSRKPSSSLVIYLWSVQHSSWLLPDLFFWCIFVLKFRLDVGRVGWGEEETASNWLPSVFCLSSEQLHILPRVNINFSTMNEYAIFVCFFSLLLFLFSKHFWLRTSGRGFSLEKASLNHKHDQFSQHHLLKRLSFFHCISLPPLSKIRWP